MAGRGGVCFRLVVKGVRGGVSEGERIWWMRRGEEEEEEKEGLVAGWGVVGFRWDCWDSMVDRKGRFRCELGYFF